MGDGAREPDEPFVSFEDDHIDARDPEQIGASARLGLRR